MTQVLEREQTLPTTVEAPERPEVREPQPPPRREVGPVRWIAWVVGLMTVVIAGIFVFAMLGEESDGSFEVNELTRMMAMAPEGFVSDGSFEVNELTRMMAIAPEVDDSFERNELARMLRLAPEPYEE
jgi:hypothetical protein